MQSLTPKQLEAIQALSSGLSVTAAADALGIHRTTVHHWARTIPEFRLTVDAVKQSRIDATRDAMVKLVPTALATLHTILYDETASPSLRFRIAMAIIKFVSTPEKSGRPNDKSSGVDCFADGHTAQPSAPAPAPETASKDGIHHNSSLSTQEEEAVESTVETSHETPRNAPCPCGSGDKYKRCCGKNAPPVLHQAAA